MEGMIRVTVKGMTSRDNYLLRPRRYSAGALRMAAMHRLVKIAPDQTDTGKKQQAQHEVAKILVAQGVIDPRAQPGAEDRAGEGQWREPDHLPVYQPGGHLEAQRGDEYRPVEDLENAARLVLAPSPYARPQDG